jgi:ABC-type multidrug transport system ATPase subunit
MLAISRGLASAPRLLMLDEPSMGLSPAIADEIFERIVAIHRDAKLSVLLVEQRVAEALHNADRGYVMESGAVILEGDHETLRNDDGFAAPTSASPPGGRCQRGKMPLAPRVETLRRLRRSDRAACRAPRRAQPTNLRRLLRDAQHKVPWTLPMYGCSSSAHRAR